MAMCSKSFYSALLWGANLTSNTLETLRMEGSAFRISLFFHATPNFEEYYKLTYVFFLSKIFFQFLYGNFCRKDKFFKKRKMYIYFDISIYQSPIWDDILCNGGWEVHLPLFDKTHETFTITCSLRADKNFFVIQGIFYLIMLRPILK